MARLRFFALVLVVASVTVPGHASPSRRTTGCAGNVSSGGSATCTDSIRLPHFNGSDKIDYSTLLARVVSPQANSWQVSGSLTDAKGVAYFWWYCSAGRSSVMPGAETYVSKTCEANRRTVRTRRNGTTYYSYYTADTSRPQLLRVTATVGSCTATSLRGCRFEAAADYLIAG